MKINNIGYLLKEGIRGIFQHGFMSFAAVCVTVACLLIVGSFFSAMYNVNIMVDDLNKTSEIKAYVDEDYSDAEARSVGTMINTLDNVLKSDYVSKEEALEEFKNTYDDPAALEGVNADYLRHRFEVVLMDNSKMKQTMDQISAIPGVEEISAEYEVAQGFIMLKNIVQILSIAVIAVLLVVSLLIISNTVKLAMYDRRDEIAIMKMVGATNSFIRLPYIVEGFSLGMTGAALAFCLEWVLYDMLVRWIAQMDKDMALFSFIVPFDELLWPMVFTFAAAGMFVGVVGSWTSIRKFMDV